ncbi:MAG: T9SS type A sorting domain-containing protein, partial [Ginsengibacter sp.]
VSPVVIFDPLADSFFISFDYADAPGLQYPGSTTFPLDTLEVRLTQDCGQTFTTIWKKWGADLQTINSPNFPDGNLFVPSAPSQWQNVKLYISPALNAANFQTYFVAKSNHQNNLYIDNINIYKKILPQRLKSQGYLIYPNPFSQSFIVRHARPPANLQSIAVYNSVGQLVYRKDLNGTGITEITVDVAGLAKGMYIVKLFYKDKTEVERIIKQ